MVAAPAETLKLAIDKSWEVLDVEALNFSATFDPRQRAAQLVLAGMPEPGPSMLGIPKPELGRDGYDFPGCLVCNTEYRDWNIAHPAIMAGLTGSCYTAGDSLDIENSIAVTLLDNELGGAPYPTDKVNQQEYFIYVFTPEELVRYTAYWYRIGAEERLMGGVDRAYAQNDEDLAESTTLIEPTTSIRELPEIPSLLQAHSDSDNFLTIVLDSMIFDSEGEGLVYVVADVEGLRGCLTDQGIVLTSAQFWALEDYAQQVASLIYEREIAREEMIDSDEGEPV